MLVSNIRAYCEAKGISVKKFEVICGLANGQVGKWRDEDGGHLPSLASLEKIVEVTGIPIEKWLYGNVLEEE